MKWPTHPWMRQCHPRFILQDNLTLEPGSQVNFSRSVISLAPSATQAVIVGTVQLAKAPEPPILTLYNQTFTRNSNSAYTIQEQTLARGAQISLPPSKGRIRLLSILKNPNRPHWCLLPSLLEGNPSIRTARRNILLAAKPSSPVVPNSIHNLCFGWRYVYTHTASQIYMSIIFRTHSLDATHSLGGFLGRIGHASIVLASPIHSTAYLSGMFGYVCMYVYVCTWARGPESQITWHSTSTIIESF